jgi:hypothetical protein
MKKYVQFLSVENANIFLRCITELDIGITWENGLPFSQRDARRPTIGYDSADNGITEGWDDNVGKRTTPDRFLIDLQIEVLKKRKRASPKWNGDKV